MFDLAGWDVGVWLMIVIDVVAVIILGLAIAYGSRMWRMDPQDPVTLKKSDETTRRLYHPTRRPGEGSLFR